MSPLIVNFDRENIRDQRAPKNKKSASTTTFLWTQLWDES